MLPNPSEPGAPPVDLFVIGGGVNGCGIARDAAGRGLSVALAEKDDLGGATSSASTKLFHGGLRYLEYLEVGLVRHALIEREVLLQAMPHIAWPMRFVLPYDPAMRFDVETPVSRIMAVAMPWMRGRRPAWMIRAGLFLYDHLGGRKLLPGTRSVRLAGTPLGAPLDDRFDRAFEYSDCWVEDSRLVVLNARDAAARGARIMPRTRVVSAERVGDLWRVELAHDGSRAAVMARALVNAGGPWVDDVIRNVVRSNSAAHVRLVRGSHIVTRKLFDHDRCYFFQGRDGRIIFAIPYEGDFTLIGTTEAEHQDIAEPPVCTAEEMRYLLDFASQYFRKPVTEADVVWTYSGVRPLYDDGSSSATAATRDYVLRFDGGAGAPLLNVFGGKITTYRRLAEAAVARLAPHFPQAGPAWTAGVALPGGDFPVTGVADLQAGLCRDFPFLDAAWAHRLVRAYGTEARVWLDGARSADDLGPAFGATITARELDWAVDREWVRTGADFLWRRTRLGLRTTADEAAAIDAHVRARSGAEPAAGDESGARGG
ncbi:MAG TPA: glycerol-3-phosphate dehydrogenase [Rhodobacteraceae bacterium]|jgi:glycerol-3-phosphate dehydrogenase|nr:glycerol-3-phosphate dehydrogenase [Paracoccaceae bacterium]HBG99850.1 glycerol-3-phosphate dehydrogenase [Paracoccaceae bacterium]